MTRLPHNMRPSGDVVKSRKSWTEFDDIRWATILARTSQVSPDAALRAILEVACAALSEMEK